MVNTNTSQKAFALTAEQSESVISEALAASRALALDWLCAQEPEFLLVWWEELCRHKGMTPQSRKESYRQVTVSLLASLMAMLDEEVA